MTHSATMTGLFNFVNTQWFFVSFVAFDFQKLTKIVFFFSFLGGLNALLMSGGLRLHHRKHSNVIKVQFYLLQND